MAEALVSTLLEQLVSPMYQEIEEEVRQVGGVRNQVDKLTSTLQVIQAALIDAEERQVKEKVVKDWLEKLRDVCYDMEDVLDDWSTAILKSQIERVENDRITMKKVCSYIYSLCHCFSQVGVRVRHDIACKIKELNGRLEEIDSEKNKYHFKSITSTREPEQRRSASFIDESEVYGRVDAKESIVNQLLSESSREKKGLHIISIVGMGGIGKTTLAQLAYNDGAVEEHFDQRIWVCVSDPFDEIRIAKLIVKGLDGNDPSSLDWENLPQQIHESTKGKKFLLVLDDVWLDDESTEAFQKWETLKHSLSNGAQGSTILVTTRNERVATIMGTTYTCRLGELSKEVCWTIFSQKAFSERSIEDCKKLEEIGKEIANKCKGLPLAAKTLGGLMRFKKSKEEWENVLNSKIWELKVAEIGIFSHLFLSYNDLPWEQKPCFSYCAIFQKDYEIQVDDLIRLWMAQGYLNPRRPGEEMETIGREYFENLAMRSFFQDFEKDEYSGSICKMHDIVHDFAQFLTKKECFHMEVDGAREPSVDSSCGKTRHLTVELAAEAPLPLSIYSRKNLRTLFVANNSGPSIIQPDLFHHLKCLRVLDLSDMGIEELPREVENLMHLRYLNLSGNKIKELPETVCNLCNLQTLNLDGCGELEELPKGMGKLINLRHLQIPWGLRSLPKGIGRLSSLQTLSRFIISGSHEREGCKLGDLKDLNSLRGELEVVGLGNVEDASEAEKADLKRKKHLRRLVLEFDCARGAEVVAGGEKMCEVIEALQPHSNLESLFIRFYKGSVFPNWMMLLPNLKKITLIECPHIVCLPPLGKLPPLESLDIKGMESVKKVGIEFLGKGIDASLIIAFPMLKKLSFSWMEEWEDWDVMITKRREEDKITIMPSLRSLTFYECPKLKALPPLGKLPSLESVYIRGMDSVKKVGIEFLGIGIDASLIIAFPMLKHLSFGYMREWEEWEDWDVMITKRREEDKITIMPSLRSLSIEYCPKLKALPHHLHTMPLEKLKIYGCPILKARCQKEIGEDWAIISHIPNIII